MAFVIRWGGLFFWIGGLAGSGLGLKGFIWPALMFPLVAFDRFPRSVLTSQDGFNAGGGYSAGARWRSSSSVLSICLYFAQLTSNSH